MGGAGAGHPTWRPPALPNVDGLLLQLRPFDMSQRFFERPKLLKALKKHYLAEVRRQIHKILMHTDVASLVADKSAVARAGRGVISTLTGRRTALANAAGGLAGARASAGAADLAALLGGRPTSAGSAAVGSGRLRLPRVLMGAGAK